MKKFFYNNPARLVRSIGRLFTTQYKVYAEKELPTPAVYIIHHQNLRGPVTSMLWVDTPFHLWTFSPFCNQETCYRQYVDYTFTKRFGMPEWLAAIIAYPISFLVSAILKSAKVIPVYRHSTRIIETFKQSVSVLLKNENVLICPDVDYRDTGSEIKTMYTGFLNIDKYYMEQTGKHVPFVPLHINRIHKAIYIGDALYFKDSDDFKGERTDVIRKLKHRFEKLEQLDRSKEAPWKN